MSPGNQMTLRAVLLSFRGEINQETFGTGTRILWLTVIFGSVVLSPILDLLLFGPLSVGQSYSYTSNNTLFGQAHQSMSLALFRGPRGGVGVVSFLCRTFAQRDGAHS